MTTPRPDLLADLALKLTLLLALGLLAVSLLSRRRPALAASAGYATLVGLWLLPLALVGVPTLTVRCLPAERLEPIQAPAIVDVEPEPVAALPAFNSPAALPALMPTLPVEPPPFPVAEPEPSPPAEPWDPFVLAALAYGAVSALLLIRLAVSLLAVSRLVRRATPVLNSTWSDSLGELNCNRSDVQLLWSERIGIPVVIGWLRPAILLPPHLVDADAATARAVLLHELAHIRRHDYPWNLFLRLTLAACWPHPLAWLLARSLSESRERACDAYCVHALGGPAPYADALLAVVAARLNSRIPTPSLGLAMARPSRLRSRLVRIARTPGTPSAAPSLPARLSVLLLALPLAALLGPLQLARVEARPTLDDPPAQKSVDPKSGARTLTVRVVSAETGQPLARPEARVWIGTDGDWRTGDDRGLLRIPHSPNSADRLTFLDVSAPGHALQRHDLFGTDVPDDLTVKLHPGETLGGLVQDESGRPIPGATVLVGAYDYKRKDTHEFFWDLRAVTGPDGRWQTTSAPEPEQETLKLRVIHPDFARVGTSGRPRVNAPLADLRAGRCVVTLQKGTPIEGRVTDDQGRPVAGADVFGSPMPGMHYTQFDVDRVKTDVDGRFRLGQVQPGTWHVWIIAKGFTPFTKSISVDRATPDLQVHLAPGHVLKGRVVDPSGKPVAGAHVHYLSLGDIPYHKVEFYTDDEGRFRWDGAPKGGIGLRIDAPGFSPLGRRNIAADGDEEPFHLSRSLSIQGTIYDARTNAFIKIARLEYGVADPETGAVAKWVAADAAIPRNLPFIGLDIPADAEAYRLRIKADGYEPFLSRVFRTSEKVIAGYEVKLEPIAGEPVKAVAVDPDGRPARKAVAFGLMSDNRYLLDGSRITLAGQVPVRAYRADAKGEFTIPRGGSWIAVMGDSGYAFLPRADLEAARRVTLKPYARIEGRAWIERVPLANRSVSLYGRLVADAPEDLLQINTYVKTDESGRFVFEKIVPSREMELSSTEQPFVPGTPVTYRRQRVEARSGQTTQVVFGGKGRTIRGRVTFPGDKPSGTKVALSGRISIQSNRLEVPYPTKFYLNSSRDSVQEASVWHEAWKSTQEGIAYQDAFQRYDLPLAEDGSFEIPDVLPDDYRLLAWYEHDAERLRKQGPGLWDVRAFRVGALAGGDPGGVIDLGAVPLHRQAERKKGDPVPPFELKVSDGRVIRSEDLRGKYVFANFEDPDRVISLLHLSTIGIAARKSRANPRVECVSLILADDSPSTRRYIAEKGQTWPQAILGTQSTPALHPLVAIAPIDQELFPNPILIGPDGKLVAWGPDALSALDALPAR